MALAAEASELPLPLSFALATHLPLPTTTCLPTHTPHSMAFSPTTRGASACCSTTLLGQEGRASPQRLGSWLTGMQGWTGLGHWAWQLASCTHFVPCAFARLARGSWRGMACVCLCSLPRRRGRGKRQEQFRSRSSVPTTDLSSVNSRGHFRSRHYTHTLLLSWEFTCWSSGRTKNVGAPCVWCVKTSLAL